MSATFQYVIAKSTHNDQHFNDDDLIVVDKNHVTVTHQIAYSSNIVLIIVEFNKNLMISSVIPDLECRKSCTKQAPISELINYL